MSFQVHNDKHKTVTGQEEEYLNDGPYIENTGLLFADATHEKQVDG